jgi:hypothetical protein
MSDDQETDERESDRERERKAYQLTSAQYERWRELLALPAGAWPPTLQRTVRIALEREGRRRDAVLWAVADYVRRTVPKTQV